MNNFNFEMDSIIWNVIWEVCCFVDSDFLYKKAIKYYYEKLITNEHDKIQNFHPNQIQMTCVYKARISILREARES